jgi:hypothetical protein
MGNFLHPAPTLKHDDSRSANIDFRAWEGNEAISHWPPCENYEPIVVEVAGNTPAQETNNHPHNYHLNTDLLTCVQHRQLNPIHLPENFHTSDIVID